MLGYLQKMRAAKSNILLSFNELGVEITFDCISCSDRLNVRAIIKTIRKELSGVFTTITFSSWTREQTGYCAIISVQDATKSAGAPNRQSRYVNALQRNWVEIKYFVISLILNGNFMKYINSVFRDNKL